MTRSFDQLKSENQEAYVLIFEMEVLLREIIAVRMERSYGSKWAKLGLPEDIRRKVQAAIAHERTITWHKLTPHHPLYYVDFPDLRKVVVSGTNWPSIFSTLFGNKL